jgi:polyhydroxyalkanoate synthesis regulator phasin
MVDKPQAADAKVSDLPPATPPIQPPAPRRGPGHRSTDARDTVAEMALRAQEISQEAGSKIATAIKDVINAAAGLAGFTIESARDIVQYMVRRGQMAQEEADRIIREAEEAHGKRKATGKPVVPAPAPAPAPAPMFSPPAIKKPTPAPAPVAIPAEKPATQAAPAKPAAAKPAKTAHPAHAASRPAAKKSTTAASRPKASAKKPAKKKR